nr:MAG TPA: outer membrane protein assembly factor [Caudoviricetes sp.]
MGKIKIITLLLLAVITFASCAASRKVEQGSSEQRRDSTVTIVKDSVAKSETRTDSSTVTVTDENHTFGSMTDKGSKEETITERVTESTDTQGNKTTTTDRTIHRKGDYERNASFEARIKHQEEIISRMQHTIDSLVLSNRQDVGTHWAKKDSTNVVKEKNTKEIKSTSAFDLITLFLFWIAVIGICTWLYNKR